MSYPRRDFLKKGLLGLSAFSLYEKPVVELLPFSSLDSIDPHAASFEDITYYPHYSNHLKDTDDNSYWAHIYRDVHNWSIEDKDYWNPQIESTIQSSNSYCGEVLRGSGTNRRMILGYATTLPDGRQLWAEVVKVTNLVNDAGLNTTPWVWVDGSGFKQQEANSMALVDLTYELMRAAVEQGAKTLGVPLLNGYDYTVTGMFVIFGERFVTWENGGSVDPAFFGEYERKYNERFESGRPTAADTYEFARDYIRWHELDVTLADAPDEEGPFACFCAGISAEGWSEKFAEFSSNLVE